jgi:hypothetical protein
MAREKKLRIITSPERMDLINVAKELENHASGRWKINASSARYMAKILRGIAEKPMQPIKELVEGDSDERG